MELKPISHEAIPAALEKAEQYRLLNDPVAAESICHDVLVADPDNQQALVALLLSITDNFGDHVAGAMQRARAVLPKIQDTYKREYYAGIIDERGAMAKWRHGGAGSGEIAYDWLQRALRHYEKAESMRPHGNDEAILRWNACVRTLKSDPQHLHAAHVGEYEPALE